MARRNRDDITGACEGEETAVVSITYCSLFLHHTVFRQIARGTSSSFREEIFILARDNLSDVGCIMYARRDSVSSLSHSLDINANATVSLQELSARI